MIQRVCNSVSLPIKILDSQNLALLISQDRIFFVLEVCKYVQYTGS